MDLKPIKDIPNKDLLAIFAIVAITILGVSGVVSGERIINALMLLLGWLFNSGYDYAKKKIRRLKGV